MPAAAAFVAVTALFACFSFAVPATGSRAPDLSVEGTNEAAAPGWQRVWQQVQQQRLCRFTALMQVSVSPGEGCQPKYMLHQAICIL